jgi:hypothetical protein
MSQYINGKLSGGSAINTSSKEITFTGAAGYGAVGNVVYFTVTGAVHIVSIDAVVTTSLGVDAGAGVASVSLGTTGNTTLFVAATTATSLTTTARLWYSNAPSTNGIALPATMKDIAIKQNIVIAVTTTGAQLVDEGAIVLTVTWLPITSDGNLA